MPVEPAISKPTECTPRTCKIYIPDLTQCSKCDIMEYTILIPLEENMKRTLLLALLMCSAAQAGTVEAVLRNSVLYQGLFYYKYLAYDASKDLKQNVVVKCGYTTYEGKMVLNSLDVKVMITDDFDSRGEVQTRTGYVNIRQEMLDCHLNLSKTENILEELTIPVRINLPQVSLPLKI